MARIFLFDLLWITVDPVEEFHELDRPKKLSVECAEKLVTDVSLISKYCLRLPKPVHLLILSTAIKKKRILSITQLIKSCPVRTLEIPIPEFLKSVHSILRAGMTEFDSELRDFTRISITMLSAFLDLILEDNSNTKLETLDLGLIPIRSKALNMIKDFLIKFRSKEVFSLSKTYTLKCCITVESSKDLHVLSTCIRDGALPGFNFNIRGIYYYNNYFPDVLALNLLESLSVTNLQMVGFSFATLMPRIEPFLKKLQSYKMVQYLNLSYLTEARPTESICRNLSVTLSQLTTIKRLSLKCMCLPGKLNALFLEHCKKKSQDVPPLDCCLVHSGSLEYLDVSSCRLIDDDLQLFREIALTNSLKYLDVSYCSFSARRAFDILLSLKSSLYALNVGYALDDQEDNYLVLPFSLFTKLKFLNMRGLTITQSNQLGYEEELRKMSSLEVLLTDAAFPECFLSLFDTRCKSF